MIQASLTSSVLGIRAFKDSCLCTNFGPHRLHSQCNWCIVLSKYMTSKTCYKRYAHFLDATSGVGSYLGPGATWGVLTSCHGLGQHPLPPQQFTRTPMWEGREWCLWARWAGEARITERGNGAASVLLVGLGAGLHAHLCVRGLLRH